MASKQSQGIPTTAITADLVGGEVYNPQQQHTQPWQIPVQTVQTHPGGENGGSTIEMDIGIGGTVTVADNKPKLTILEQPKSRGFRFRYDCEGQSHGGLPGETSERNRKSKTYPTVQLVNYRGRARIVVSLVTESDPPLPHAHSIVGRNTENGQCTVEVGPENDMCATFPNLGILHVTRKKVVDVLTDRFIQNKAMQISMQGGDPSQQLGDAERDAAKREADKVSKGMNLSVVRLCFQAYLPDDHGYFRIPLDPVFSQKVYDSKAPSASTLKISRIDRPSGSVRGGDEVYLLCDKVQKNDIEVVFYEETAYVKQEPGESRGWEAVGTFGPQDVHHQYAIVFKTPPYYNMAIERPVTVQLALRRPSDKELSDSKPFTYLPQEYDEERIGHKRRKKIEHFSNFFGNRMAPMPPPSGGGPTGGGDPNSQGSFMSGLGFGGQFGGNYGGGGNNYSNQGNQSQINYGSQQAPFSQPQTGLHPSALDTAYTSHSHQEGISRANWDWTGAPSNPPPYGSGSMYEFGNASQPSTSQGYQPSISYGGDRGTSGSSSTHLQPPTKTVATDLENEESGVCDSQVPSLNEIQENLHQQLMEARAELAGRQRQIMEVCERLTAALFEWARTKDVRYLLSAQQQLTCVQNEDGDTALHVAIINNHIDVVRSLLDVIPQVPTDEPVVNLQNHLQQSPLHLAVLTKQPEVAKLLRSANASSLIRDRNGNTAIHLACQQGSCEMATALLSPLDSHAAQASVIVPELSMLNSAGYSPLHLAVLCGNLQTVKVLQSAGANLCPQDSCSGRTPLHYIAENGDDALTGYFIVQADMKLDQCDYHGNTPLHLAAGSGHHSVIQLLLSAGASCNIINNEGETALDLARMKGHTKAIQVLEGANALENQADDIAYQLHSVNLGEPKIKKEPSDMWMLTYLHRCAIAKILDKKDHGRAWMDFARRIGVEKLIPAFEIQPSPTLNLLEYFEDHNGTVDDLKGHFLGMKSPDLADVVEKALKEPGLLSSHQDSSDPLLGDPFLASKQAYDSGISSGQSDSFLPGGSQMQGSYQGHK